MAEKSPDLQTLATAVGQCLAAKNLMLATAESCTGGWLAQAITSVAGSSAWFERGFITYSNTAKIEMLGVNPETLKNSGAVSRQTVAEMIAGALRFSHAQTALAISGIAGPSGGNTNKPIGTVYIGWGQKDKPTYVEHCCFKGDREDIRRQAVIRGLQGILTYQENSPPTHPTGSSHRTATSKLAPITEEKVLNQTQKDALQRLRQRISNGYHLGGKKLNRDAMYGLLFMKTM